MASLCRQGGHVSMLTASYNRPYQPADAKYAGDISRSASDGGWPAWPHTAIPESVGVAQMVELRAGGSVLGDATAR